MNILFVHNNFPAQYRYLSRALLRQGDMRVAAVGSPTARSAKGIRLLKYAFSDVDVSATHPFARRFDLECRRAEQVIYNLTSLASSGFTPDIIFAHPGWGETLPLKSFFPKAKLLMYCEFYYGTSGQDLDFDDEFPESGLDGRVNLHLKNATSLLGLTDCDQGVSPTNWQRSTFPLEYQPKIEVIHEGVDVDVVKPTRHAVFTLPSGSVLTPNDEVVTFVARNLEPLRGYHVFMRALPRILSRRPNAQVIIVGGSGVSYGLRPPSGTTWKSHFFKEVSHRIDAGRVHFVGNIAYQHYLTMLQVSSAHVYLTYPFVLSWSLLEAMSAGCAIVGSDTPPVAEVVDGHNGLLVPFFDVEALADQVVEVLANPRRYKTMRARARQLIVDRFDAERICVPRMMALINEHQPGAPQRSQPAVGTGHQTTDRHRRRAAKSKEMPIE